MTAHLLVDSCLRQLFYLSWQRIHNRVNTLHKIIRISESTSVIINNMILCSFDGLEPQRSFELNFSGFFLVAWASGSSSDCVDSLVVVNVEVGLEGTLFIISLFGDASQDSRQYKFGHLFVCCVDLIDYSHRFAYILVYQERAPIWSDPFN